jgi:hypothetical protein
MSTVRYAGLACIGVVLASLALEMPHMQGLSGIWEGEIQTPDRPVVAIVDFDKRIASFDGGAPLAVVNQQELGGGKVDFDVMSGPRALKFTGTRDADTFAGRFAPREGVSFAFSFTRFPTIPPPRNRVEAWEQDFDAVSGRFLRYDRSFDDGGRTLARARLEQLKQSTASMTDAELIMELSRVVAMSRNAHTRLYFIRNRTDVGRLPIRVWWFGDELRIVRATAEQRRLLGCHVTGIGPRSTAEAFARVRDVKAGNASWQRYMSSYYLTSPDALASAHVTAAPQQTPLRLMCEGRAQSVTLSTLPLVRSLSPVEAWWDISPTHPQGDPQLSSFALQAGRAPRYLRNTNQNYWFEYVSEDGVLYFQYNRAESVASRSMASFVQELTEAATGKPLRAFVVDLRFNTGGDLNLATPLVKTIAPLLGGVPVFVLTGRATFSAGITHAAQWKQLAGAALVGEQVGDDLDFWSEGGNLRLPNSGLTVHYANGFHKYSQREYPSLKPYYFELQVSSLDPDIPVETRWADYIRGRDPLYSAVLQRMRGR